MGKSKTLKRLSVVQHKFEDAKKKFDTLVNDPIWIAVFTNEIDDTLKALQIINKTINDLINTKKDNR